MIKLTDVAEGHVAIVSKINGNARFLSRIVSIGITLGGVLQILRNEKKMPILIYSRDSMIALNRCEGENIIVEVQ